MSEKFDFIELMRYFANMAHIEEIDLGKYRVLYLLSATSKARTEYFVFDADDTKGVSDEEIGDMVKSSPYFETRCEVDGDKSGRYRFVRFNTRIPLYERLDLFTKRFLEITKDANIQRRFQLGKSGNNPNPKFYKDVWWVFHKGVNCDNIEELIKTDESKFVNQEKVDEFIKELQQKNRPYAIVHKTYVRLGVKAFDYAKMREKEPDIEFAPALEDDEER